MTATDFDVRPDAPTERVRIHAPFRLSRPRGADWVTFVAAAIFIVMLLLAFFGTLLTPYDPSAQDLSLASSGPSAGHLFGTDQLGRDIASRVIVGAKTAVLGPLVIALIATTLSALLGLLAGYRGGWTDGIVGRVLDVIYALPPLLVAIVVVGVLGGGFTLGIVVLIVLGVPAGFRNMRASAIEQRSLPYIESARVLGQSKTKIMFHQVLPNIRPVLFATFFLAFTYGFVDLSTLSFLGLGVAPGTADWGLMAAESRVLVFENPLALIVPLGLIVIAAVSANLVGQGLDSRMITNGSER